MPLVTPDIMREWRLCTGLYKGLQNELILKNLHKTSMRDSLLCPSHSGCAVSGIHTPMQEARTNGRFGWVCSATELKKNSDRQNNPDLDNEDKTNSIQVTALPPKSTVDVTFFFFNIYFYFWAGFTPILSRSITAGYWRDFRKEDEKQRIAFNFSLVFSWVISN